MNNVLPADQELAKDWRGLAYLLGSRAGIREAGIKSQKEKKSMEYRQLADESPKHPRLSVSSRPGDLGLAERSAGIDDAHS
jgi:hypothetical protein